MTVEEKLNGFIARQVELVALDQEVGAKIKALEAKANADCEEITRKAMAEADELRAPLKKKIEEYRADVKAAFGIADGETMNVVQMLKAVLTVAPVCPCLKGLE